ncbi:hypothetical protein [Sphingomonas sp.]|uniref:hypothetical protein n=1 Tax=Sphingomonas sp. TaxID=28214 RepID=UPI00307E972A
MIDFNKIDAVGDRFAAQAQAAREQLPVIIAAVEHTVQDLCRNPSINAALARRALRVEVTHDIEYALISQANLNGNVMTTTRGMRGGGPLVMMGVSYYLVPSLDPSPGWRIVNPWEPSDG